ncbi:HNH endonuclease signature motif containing protein [Streptomyces sp. NPDC051183]|uniref:HNH endonuclease signature motif containing protein n=1 Tax=Streptomyces sp. NPDC051183 TaxID=3155165 RepID=UPI003439E0EF
MEAIVREEAAPTWQERHVRLVAQGARRFVDGITEGDFVVAVKAGLAVHIGMVQGPAYYEGAPGSAFANRRPVTWIRGDWRIPYDTLPDWVRQECAAYGYRPPVNLSDGAAEYFRARLIPLLSPSAPPGVARPRRADEYAALCQGIVTTEPRKREEVLERDGTAWYRDRRAVKAVLRRSKGRCESKLCGGMPNDVTPKGKPILEVDHIDELSRGGMDHPKNMIALCLKLPCHEDARQPGR